MTDRPASRAETLPLPAVAADPARSGGSEAQGELWRVAFDQAPFSTVVYDAAGRLLAVNAAFEAFWGVSRGTAPPEYSVLQDQELERQGILPLIRRAFAGETVVTPPVQYDISKISVNSEGRTLWTQAHLYPVRDDADRVTHVVLTHIDLTDRIAAEEALRASERRFAAIVQQAAAGIAQVDLSGRFTLVNDRYCQILGRPRAELLELRMQDVTHPDDLPPNLPLFAGAVASGTSFVIEKRYLRPDGSVVWVNNSVAAIRGLSGDTESVLAVAFEVTDRRSAMERLELLAIDNERLYEAERSARMEAERAADRSRRLQAVAAALNEATTPAQVAEVCVTAGLSALDAGAGSLALLVEDGTVFEVVHTSGYAPEQVERWRRFPFAPGKPLSDAVLQRTPILLGTGEQWARYSHVTPDLEPSQTRALAAVPLVIGGRALAALAFSWTEPRSFDEGDRSFLVTLGEQGAQALERARLFEAEQRARTTAERLQELTLALSGALSGEEVGRAVMQHGVVALGANAGVLALLTAEADELELAASTGYPTEACMSPGRRWPIDAGIPIAEATRSGASVLVPSPAAWGYRYLGGYMPKNGASAAWAAFPIVLDGRTVGALLWTYNEPRSFLVEEVALMETVARQCTQALERASLLQAERQARADAEAANRAKSEFLSAMSHELRTPLNAIFGYVDLLEVGVHGPLTDAQRADLGRIRNAQEVLLGLISDILNFARIEAGRIEYQKEAVPLDRLLGELEDLIGPQMQARRLRYRWGRLPEELAVLGDHERIRQILMNLLSNALKFTEPGGRVEVSTQEAAERVLIRVSDTGRGIPADQHEEIFNPFVQVDRHGTPESQQGVGLGLAISRELARAMGGDLSVESEPARGSTFTLVLPRAPLPE